MEEVKEPAVGYDERYTYADYLKFEFEYMVELIRGKIFKMTPAPSMRHQEISANLHSLMWFFLKGKNCKVFAAPTDIVLPIENKKRNKSQTVVQPDICILCDTSIIEEQAAFGPPTLVVEILSSHTKKKDLQLKYDIYEEAGVQEYWIVLPNEEMVEQFILVNGKYGRIGTFTIEDEISAQVLPGLKVQLSEIFS